MKLLHTGDWHVGKGLQGRSRADEHIAVLAEIAGIARTEEVDLIAVAGDIFDTAAPPPEAERITYNALLELSRVAPVVVIPGNHDNDRRLGAVASLFELANVTVRAYVTPEPLVFETKAGEQVRVATLPWMSQRYLVKAEHLMTMEASDLAGQYAERVGRVIDKLAEGFSDDAVNLLIGHVTLVGAALGGGERTAQTIFDYWIPSNAFPATAHYVGLGHLHKLQKMAGPCPIYYCGSPLQLDFSDTEDRHHALVVEASPGKPASVREIPLASGRKLRTVSGTVEQLKALADSVGDDFLRVIVEEKVRAGLGDEVREFLPNAVKVIVESGGDEKAAKRIERTGASPRDLFVEYLAERKVDDPRLVELFQDLYEQAP